jgi:hypothetical protein
MSHLHWVVRGTGTPTDREEVNRREVCVIGALSLGVPSELIR